MSYPFFFKHRAQKAEGIAVSPALLRRASMSCFYAKCIFQKLDNVLFNFIIARKKITNYIHISLASTWIILDPKNRNKIKYINK